MRSVLNILAFLFLFVYSLVRLACVGDMNVFHDSFTFFCMDIFPHYLSWCSGLFPRSYVVQVDQITQLEEGRFRHFGKSFLLLLDFPFKRWGLWCKNSCSFTTDVYLLLSSQIVSSVVSFVG